MPQRRYELREPEVILIVAVDHDDYERSVDEIAACLHVEPRIADRKISRGRWLRGLIDEGDLWASVVLLYRLRSLESIMALRPISPLIAKAMRTVLRQDLADLRLQTGFELARHARTDTRSPKTEALVRHDKMLTTLAAIREEWLARIDPLDDWPRLKGDLVEAIDRVIAFHRHRLAGIMREGHVAPMREEDLGVDIFCSRGRRGGARGRRRRAR